MVNKTQKAYHAYLREIKKTLCKKNGHPKRKSKLFANFIKQTLLANRLLIEKQLLLQHLVTVLYITTDSILDISCRVVYNRKLVEKYRKARTVGDFECMKKKVSKAIRNPESNIVL
jgi:hypothetical protein